MYARAGGAGKARYNRFWRGQSQKVVEIKNKSWTWMSTDRIAECGDATTNQKCAGMDEKMTERKIISQGA